jgi:hypothetical protein
MTRSVDAYALRILLCLYLVEAAFFSIVVGIYKAPVYNWTLLSTKAGAALMAGGAGLITSGSLLVRQVMSSGSLRGRALALGLVTNLVLGLVVFLLLETTVQIVARRTDASIMVGSVTVRPTWSELIARSRAVISGVTASSNDWSASYFVYDRELGWTVGANRQSPNGLYFSSVEGIRSAGPNIRMADQTPRFRVALIGDSNAFSFEVPFEDSWGYHLQQLLGDNVQVLNFGVDGYGIDQIYLRYKRDVLPWKPRVVVIGVIGHDFWRTMAVYPFVSFGWPGYLVKPRFAIEKGKLELLNVPLPTPNETLGTDRIQHLPFIEYDLAYGTTDWDWRFDHGPLFFRFLTSVFPRWRIADPRVSKETAKTLNSRLLARLVKTIEQVGAVPLVVFLSSSKDTLAREILSSARVRLLDVSGCLSEVPASRRRTSSGHHYTGSANYAIAKCTAPAINLALKRTGRFAAPRHF